MINKSYKHWMIVFFMCCLAASSIGLCTNAIGVFYTPVAKSLKVLKGTFAMHATLSTLATALTSLKMSKVIKKYFYKKVLLIGVILYFWNPGKEVYYFKDFDEIANFVSNNAEAGDLVITMGAGDIYKVADIMLERDWKKR